MARSSSGSIIGSLLAAVSAGLCVALVALWLTNQLYRQEIIYGRALDAHGARWIIDAGADMDGVLLDFADEQRVDSRYVALVGWHFYAGEYPEHYGRWLSYNPTNWRFLGLAYGADQAWRQGFQHSGILVVQARERWLLLPYWLLIALTAIPPLVWFARRRADHHRRARNLCVICGYDLRATPEATGPLLERCPECGAETGRTIKPPRHQADQGMT
jgi:hypothetical protein